MLSQNAKNRRVIKLKNVDHAKLEQFDSVNAHENSSRVPPCVDSASDWPVGSSGTFPAIGHL